MSAVPTLKLNDGHTMPQVGFGLWQVPNDSASSVVQTALSLGYRLLDGAALYGNEVEFGEGLRRADIDREEVFVTTKVWNDRHGYDSALRAIDESLARIGVETLDLCLIHWPCPDKDLYVETWKALIEAKSQGKTRSIGVSNFNADHLERIIGETGEVPVLNQIELHPQMQQPELRGVHAEKGIVTQSWTPLGKSLSFDHPVVVSICERTGHTPAQVVLRWNIQLGCAVIPRSTNAQRMAQNLAIADFELTEDEMAAMAVLHTKARLGPDPLQFS
ncbi:MAG: aldo/keto reductase [Pseudomonadota bacterium]